MFSSIFLCYMFTLIFYKYIISLSYRRSNFECKMFSDNTYCCNKCEYKNTKDNWSQHSDIMCDQCDYKVPLPAGLRQHTELKHGKTHIFVTKVLI